MNKKVRAVIIPCVFGIVFSFLLSLALPAVAQEMPSLEEAAAVYFYHLESGQVVLEKNIDTKLYAGSSVKVMAGLLLCEHAAGHEKETVTIEKKMLSGVWGHSLGLRDGDMLTVEQLLYGAVCGSYNDAIYVLASYFAGSVDLFVEWMNQRASTMGLSATVYTDPVGIDDNSMTTASDVAKVALEAGRNELYRTICKTSKYQFPATLAYNARTIYNRNAMIASPTTNKYYNSRCIGMSAGSTSKGGQCVIALAEDKGETYLCVVMGAKETDDTEYGYIIANRLIDWVYKTYTYLEVINPEVTVCTIPVKVSDMTTEVEVKANKSLLVYLPADANVGEEIQYSIRLLYNELEAPVHAGTHVGYVAIVYGDRILGTIELYTAQDAERSNVISSLMTIQGLTKNRAFIAGLIFFILVLATWITLEAILRQKRRHKWDKYFGNKMGVHPDLYDRKKK